MTTNKTNQAGTKAAATTKATQEKPAAQTKASKGYVVAEGHAFHGRDGRIEAGTAVTAADLKSKLDPTGAKEFQRQIDKGALIPGTGKAKASDERAGGGVIDNGGATGAGPSAAQILAAETGNDPDAAAVVDATLAGTESDVAAANGADGDAGKGE